MNLFGLEVHRAPRRREAHKKCQRCDNTTFDLIGVSMVDRRRWDFPVMTGMCVAMYCCNCGYQYSYDAKIDGSPYRSRYDTPPRSDDEWEVKQLNLLLLRSPAAPLIPGVSG